MDLCHFWIFIAETIFELPVLKGLKARALAELIAKAQIVTWGHRREDLPRLFEVALDLRDPREHFQCWTNLLGCEGGHRRAELMETEPDPELGGLVNRDEEMLVMFIGDGLKSIQELVELKIAAIAHILTPVDLLTLEIDVRT